MKILNQNGLQETNDYDLFKIREDNRDLDRNHVKNLKHSLEANNDLKLKPIIVNSDYEIIDGQHRFMAAKDLGVTIYYLIDDNYDSKKMIEFNTLQKNWKPEDYLKYWINHGNEDYLKFNEFCKDIGFRVSLMLSWLTSSGGSTSRNFKTGLFKFKIDEISLKALVDTKKLIKILTQRNYKPLVTFTQASFHEACKTFFKSPIVEPDLFFENLEKCPFQLRYSRAWQEYLDQFVEIYNFNLKKDKIKVIVDGNKRTLYKG